jgi:hypothetical protein
MDIASLFVNCSVYFLGFGIIRVIAFLTSPCHSRQCPHDTLSFCLAGWLRSFPILNSRDYLTVHSQTDGISALLLRGKKSLLLVGGQRDSGRLLGFTQN